MPKNNERQGEKNDSQQCVYGKEDKDDIIRQIESLRAENNSIQYHFLTMISISLGVYGVVLFEAFKCEREGMVNYAFIILPFLFAISIQNIIKYTIRMLGIDAYLCHLEGILNTICGKPIYLWHRKLIHANGYTFVGGFVQIPCYLALTVVIGSKFVENIKKDFIGKYIVIVLMCVELLFLLISLLICATEYNSLLYWSERLSRGDKETRKKPKNRNESKDRSDAPQEQIKAKKVSARQDESKKNKRKRNRPPKNEKNDNGHAQDYLNTRGFLWHKVFKETNIFKQSIYYDQTSSTETNQENM